MKSSRTNIIALKNSRNKTFYKKLYAIYNFS